MNYEQFKKDYKQLKEVIEADFQNDLHEGVVADVSPDGLIRFTHRDGGWIEFGLKGAFNEDQIVDDDFMVFGDYIEIEERYMYEYYMYAKDSSDDHDIQNMDIYPHTIYDSVYKDSEITDWVSYNEVIIENSPWLSKFFRSRH